MSEAGEVTSPVTTPTHRSGFTRWLLGQGHRDDPVGHLACGVYRDLCERRWERAAGKQDGCHWPAASRNLEDYLAFLLSDGAPRYSVQACVMAWAEYHQEGRVQEVRVRRPTIPETGKVVEVLRPDCPPPAA